MLQTLINDKQQRLMPSLRLSITDANFHVLGSGKSYRALGRFVIGAQYYNIKFAEWQQLLILPRMEAEMDTSVSTPSVKLESVAIPTLVITDAVLATLSGIVSAFAEDDEGTGGLAKIVNSTGLGIAFWVGGCEQPPLCGENMLSSGSSATVQISNPYASEQAEDAGEWDYEEQLDGEKSVWDSGIVTWTPYEMTPSQTVESCYQRMLAVGGRGRARLTEVRVKCGSWIDGVEFCFADGATKTYGSVGARGATRHAFMLREGEHLSRIDWRKGEHVGRGSYGAVLQLQFWSSSNRSSRIYGRQEDGKLLSEKAGLNEEVCGIEIITRPADGGSGLHTITAAETRACFSVDIGSGRHVDAQLGREVVTRDPRMYRRVKRREVMLATADAVVLLHLPLTLVGAFQ